MFEFLQELIDEYPNLDKHFEFVTPSATALFTVDPTDAPLCERRSRIFYTLTAKGIFASKRCRPDIQVPISFLTTRVRDPTTGDWIGRIFASHHRHPPDLVHGRFGPNLGLDRWIFRCASKHARTHRYGHFLGKRYIPILLE